MALTVLIQFFPQLLLLVEVEVVAITPLVSVAVLEAVEPLVVLEQPIKVLTAVAFSTTLEVVEVREHRAPLVQVLLVALVALAYQTI
jgi:hypothetical protein